MTLLRSPRHASRLIAFAATAQLLMGARFDGCGGPLPIGGDDPDAHAPATDGGPDASSVPDAALPPDAGDDLGVAHPPPGLVLCGEGTTSAADAQHECETTTSDSIAHPSGDTSSPLTRRCSAGVVASIHWQVYCATNQTYLWTRYELATGALATCTAIPAGRAAVQSSVLGRTLPFGVVADDATILNADGTRWIAGGAAPAAIVASHTFGDLSTADFGVNDNVHATGEHFLTLLTGPVPLPSCVPAPNDGITLVSGTSVTWRLP